MIEDQNITLNGDLYVWSHVPDANGEAPWRWMRESDYTSPPSGLVARLNREFIQQRASSLRATLDDSSQYALLCVLRDMGASDDDLRVAGFDAALETDDLLKRILDPEFDRRRRFEELPPAGHTPFNSPTLRDWMFAEFKKDALLLETLSLLGEGPITAADFQQFLQPWLVTVKPPTERTGFVVVGREGWSEDEVDDLIDLHVGHSLRIYSQEMLLSHLAGSRDPFYGGPDVLAAFRAGHPGLEFVSEGWPGWVQTWVAHDRRSAVPKYTPEFEVEQSPLHVMGYRVGNSGEDDETRREILRQVFEGQLPIVSERSYMDGWGEPRSGQRLRRIAEHIANQCTKNSSRAQSMQQAIADWKDDLQWLKETFYVGHMQFHWPGTFV
jgi:hypothetical protein